MLGKSLTDSQMLAVSETIYSKTGWRMKVLIVKTCLFLSSSFVCWLLTSYMLYKDPIWLYRKTPEINKISMKTKSIFFCKKLRLLNQAITKQSLATQTITVVALFWVLFRFSTTCLLYKIVWLFKVCTSMKFKRKIRETTNASTSLTLL